LFVTNQTTFSTAVREYTAINADRPCLFVFIGTVIGLIVGLILGFILGHLFWT
jgi:ABC-type nitrate/sulfonate/bicarbonate transport system permease component